MSGANVPYRSYQIRGNSTVAVLNIAVGFITSVLTAEEGMSTFRLYPFSWSLPTEPMGHKFGSGETVSMMVGGIVGGGIYAALGIVVSIAGPTAWLAYVVAGFIALCAGYSYIHLNRNLDSNGASVTFIESFWENTTAAGMVGWTLLIGYIGTMAMYGYAFGAFSQHMLNVEQIMGIPIRPLISALVILAFIGLNLLGVRRQELSRTSPSC